MKMERGLMMVLHALIIGVLLYVFMVYVLGQSPIVAENRSVFIAALVMLYMILFGHGLPTTVNKQLF